MYNSLFDRAEIIREFQVYNRSLGSVINDIIGILNKKNKSKRDYSILVFHSPRIIRALVDCKEDRPKDLQVLELLRTGIAVSLDLYRGYNYRATLEEVVGLREEIVRVDPNLLEREIHQFPDDINLVASNPKFSEATARKLYGLLGNNKAILFAVGHGSLGIALDVILRYEELSGQRNIEFYPVRYSRTGYKGYKDRRPRLTKAEINYLQKEAEGKKLIVFDENHRSGKAVRTVAAFVSEKVALGKKVEITYNIHSGIPGEWEELYDKLPDKI